MSKILWVVNTIFPDAAVHLGVKVPIYGGWMYSLAKDLSSSKNIQLSVATVYNGKKSKKFSVNGISYYLIPQGTGIEGLKDSWRNIITDFVPDIVHIHGTEYSHGMALMNSYQNLKYAVSIQGLVSVYHRYFLAGMTTWDVLRNITFRDILRWNTLFHAKHDFYKRGLVEKEYIRKATAIIGRTDWDYAHARAINPKVDYHFCNESLRDEFYTSEKWSLKNCRRYSIFLSQAGYPIKGLHQVLKAISLLKEKYPDIMIEVAGHDITKAVTLKDRLKRDGYGRFIGRMIKQHRLENNIKFLGPLQAEEMKKTYLRAHVFICPSSIENSPNSLGEAQILGVPCIVAYCGGIPSMIGDGDSAVLYQFEEHEVLASNIHRLFELGDSVYRLSNHGYNAAQQRHDRKINLHALMTAYEKIWTNTGLALV